MPIIRKKLDPNDVYPSDMRYNATSDTVQSLVNGTWVDNPQRDPRKQTLFPPRATSDTRCDAAQSVVDAIKGEIDQTITAITNGANVTTVAGIILGLFYFGPFGVFIAIALTIARAMLDAGATALQDALTTTVYHKLACYLDCAMDAQGVITEAGLNTVMSEMSADPGGLAAAILNATLSLAGFGGVNNLAALGTSTGNCVDCPCEGWCYEWDLTVAQHLTDLEANFGIAWASGQGYSVSGTFAQLAMKWNEAHTCNAYAVHWDVTPVSADSGYYTNADHTSYVLLTPSETAPGVWQFTVNTACYGVFYNWQGASKTQGWDINGIGANPVSEPTNC